MSDTTEREYTCHFCKRQVERGHNYCSGDCMVAEARANGGVEHLPNGLPIRCVRHDNTMLEHEHGDHLDYLFPVDVEYIGEASDNLRQEFEMIYERAPKDDGELRDVRGQDHALIYTDGSVALTLYECCYAMWHVRTGEWLGGELQGKYYRLDEASLAKIREYLERKHAGGNG